MLKQPDNSHMMLDCMKNLIVPMAVRKFKGWIP